MMESFKLFDFDYECDDAAWKEKLEEQFIETFYFMEIGQETIDRWKHRVVQKFHEIMPYYNQLQKSTLMNINPMITHKNIETYSSDNSTISEVGAISKSNEYEHPQTGTSSDIPSSTMNTDGTSDSNTSGTANYLKNIEGFDGDQSELLKSYRSTILRINTLIMQECKDLFILVY